MSLETTVVAPQDRAHNRFAQFMRLLVPSFKAHALIIALVIVFLACEYGTAALLPEARTQNFATFSLGFVCSNMPILLIAVVTERFYYLVAHVRPKHPTIALAREVARIIFNPRRAANALPLIIALSAFIGAFSFFKTNIPVIVPFHWDLTLDHLDRALHFGRLPWEWLQPVVGYAPVTFVLNVSYNLWFFVMWTMWVTFALRAGPSQLRTRFFLSFVLIWSIGGALLAMVFSSAGPCYFERLGLRPNPYADLMDYLRHVDTILPIWAIKTQDLLWSGYLGQQNVVTGISAMPSMHNASTLLFALAGWQINRKLGIVLSVYAGVIFVASVHLGWHYAVDGYLSYALTLAVWTLCGPLARWNERQPWSRQFAEKTMSYSAAARSLSSRAAR